jgi:hypothetical protein
MPSTAAGSTETLRIRAASSRASVILGVYQALAAIITPIAAPNWAAK